MNLQNLRGKLLLSLVPAAAVFVGLSATLDNPVILSPPEADEESGPFAALRVTVHPNAITYLLPLD